VDIEFVECGPSGRRFTVERRVGLGDVTVSGRLRLDALANYLQDVATDDVGDVGIAGTWVLRRMALQLGDLPRFRDDVTLTTFCSGIGSHWAERRTTVRVDDRVAVETAALWVFIDANGRPAPLEDWFSDQYASAASGRRVRARLRHAPPPPGASVRSWVLRRTDFDVLAHVNNAASWQAVEDELGRVASGRRLVRAEIEYRAPVDPGDELELQHVIDANRLSCWLTCRGDVRTSAFVDFDAATPEGSG
jgi:acyl-ACP thioesterase